MTDKRQPATQPTGRPPASARRGPPPGSSPPVTPDVDVHLAWLTKVAYIQERSTWQTIKESQPRTYVAPGEYDGRGPVTLDGDSSAVLKRARSSEWYALVRWCAARDIQPEEYVRVCFLCTPHMRVRAPEPRDLQTDKYLRIWAKAQPMEEQRLRTALDWQRGQAAGDISARQSIRRQAYEFACVQAVTSPYLELTPLFRFCLATSIGTPKLLAVAGRYESRAVIQFERNRRAYLAAWKDVLPPGFADRSATVYPRLLALTGHPESR